MTKIVTARHPLSWDEERPPGAVPVEQRTKPVMSSTKMETTNAYVGSAKRAPASLTPRRFANEIRTTQANERIKLVTAKKGDSGGQRQHPGRDRHRDCQNVIREECCGRDQAREAAEFSFETMYAPPDVS